MQQLLSKDVMYDPMRQICERVRTVVAFIVCDRERVRKALSSLTVHELTRRDHAFVCAVSRVASGEGVAALERGLRAVRPRLVGSEYQPAAWRTH